MVTELEMQENLKKMEKFFKVDMSIKQALMDIAPVEADGYNKESIILYADKMYQQFEEMEYQILQMFNMYEFDENTVKIVQDKLRGIKKGLIKSGYKFPNLKEAYRNFFSGMSKQLVDEVKDTCIGYYCARKHKLPDTLSQCKTINELLHVLHSYIVNNEEILQGLPQLGEKNKFVTINTFDASGEPKQETLKFTCATLYGVKNKIAEQIYDSINPEQKKTIGEATIVGLADKVLMMVRDHGHALTIEIEDKGDNAFVKYFIPKVCNTELVNQLRGVTKVSHGAQATTGCFECGTDNIGSELISFIEKVPTDFDTPARESDLEPQSTIKDDLSNFVQKTNAQQRKKVLEIFEKLKFRKKNNEKNNRKER